MTGFAIGVLVVVGAMSLLVVGMVVTAAVCTWFLDWRNKPHQWSFEEGRQYELDRLMNDSWWFSEHEPTTILLQDLASGKNVSDARQRWRQSIKRENESE